MNAVLQQWIAPEVSRPYGLPFPSSLFPGFLQPLWSSFLPSPWPNSLCLLVSALLSLSRNMAPRIEQGWLPLVIVLSTYTYCATSLRLADPHLVTPGLSGPTGYVLTTILGFLMYNCSELLGVSTCRLAAPGRWSLWGLIPEPHLGLIGSLPW